MNPGIGAPELLVVLVIALVVVGPQQLPLLVRRIGRFMGQLRMMARDFQNSFDEIGREAELKELRDQISALKSANPINEFTGEIRKEIDQVSREASDAAQRAEIEAEAVRQLKLRDAGLAPSQGLAPPLKPVGSKTPETGPAKEAGSASRETDETHASKPAPDKGEGENG